jgi:hypothetical protein
MFSKKNLTILFFTLTLVFLPLFSAQAGVVPCGLHSDDPSMDGDQTLPCTLCHLILGVFNIFTWFKNILITVAAVGIFIAGVMYIISAGNEEMMKRAKDFLATSLIGFTIVLCAWLIVNITMWAISAREGSDREALIGQVNWYTFTCDTKSSALDSSTNQTNP